MPRDPAHPPQEPASNLIPETLAGRIPPHKPFWLWLLLLACGGVGLYLLSRGSYLLFHILAELFSVVLAAAVFTIGWNTRQMVRTPFFLILATGFLATGLIDLLHTLSYKGMGVLAITGSNLSIQLWLAARALEATTFLLAAWGLGRPTRLSPWVWLCGFLGGALILTLAIWPLQLCPTCFIENTGLTLFKIAGEYLIAIALAVAAVQIWLRRELLGERLAALLLAALVINIASELCFTLYTDPYGLANFIGHCLKLVTVVLVYHALVEGTLRSPYTTLFRELTSVNRDLDSELHRHRATENSLLAANQELLLLYRTSRVLHSTLQLDTLTHLVLSMAASPAAGGFRRAMLFLVNERTGSLQGMLGIDQSAATLIFPANRDESEGDWMPPQPSAASCEKQRQAAFNQQVIRQRLPLDADHNPLARACLEHRIVRADADQAAGAGARQLATELGMATCFCAPLSGRDHSFGVLVVEPADQQAITPERQRFLELFAGQAAAALENARLLQRLEGTLHELREVQEQLVQGEKLAVLGEMAAQVAHELKNPLVAVGGFAQRLTRLELQDPRAGEYAAIIVREVRRLEEMLGNILAFSKKQMVCLEDCDLNELLYETLTLELDQQRGGIELVTDIEAPLPRMTGDCRQLRQVVLNLLANARQAMGKGGKIYLRAGSCILRGEDAVFIQVEDTGGGISAEIMRNIFNPFFSTHPKGTGLGLSISHRIVEQHRGEIEVVNGELGACFTVRLPIKPPGIIAGAAKTAVRWPGATVP